MSERELVAGSVFGARGWRVLTWEREPRLLPLSYRGARTSWNAHQDAFAVHSSSGARHNICFGVATLYCSCGFYAFRHVTALEDMIDRATVIVESEPIVLGVIEMRGLVTVHRRGYRAERARLVGLFRLVGSSSSLRKIADALEAPVLTRRAAEELCLNSGFAARHA